MLFYRILAPLRRVQETFFEWNTHFWAPCCCLRPFSRGVSTRRRVEEGDGGGGDRPLKERGPPSWERERAPLLRRPDLSFVLSLLDPSSSSGVGWFWRRRRVRKESSSSPPPLSLESASSSSSSSSFLRRRLPRRREAPGLNGGPPPPPPFRRRREGSVAAGEERRKSNALGSGEENVGELSQIS